MRNFGKLSLIFTIAASLFLGFSISSAYAASVGEQLTEPEAGWQRIDDDNELFIYSGTWSARPPQLGPTYNGGFHYTSSTNATLKFRFFGTKLRYIGQTYSNKANVVRINIDGVEETFKQRGANTYQIINYEKLNLPLGYHDVIISFDDSQLMFDAIDIDDFGRLVDINEPLPAPEQPETPEDPVNEGPAPGQPGSEDPTNPSPEEPAAPEIPGNEQPGSNDPTTEEPTTHPSGDRAILVVTMINDLEKEYDLSMSEVNSFIDWYDAKDSGSGPSKYAIDKHDNNIGPFNSRTDYVIFNNILTFQVNAYSN